MIDMVGSAPLRESLRAAFRGDDLLWRRTETPMASVYDLIVIGSGPAGQRAAIYGSKLGKKVALVERCV